MSKKRRKSGSKNKNKGTVEQIVNAGKWGTNRALRHQLFLHFIINTKSNNKNFRRDLTRLMRFNFVRKLFNAFNSSVDIESMGKNKYIPGDLQKQLDIYFCTFSERSEKLHGFTEDAEEFEKLLFIGKLDKAENLLRKIKEKTGETFWFVRSNIILLKEQDKLEELHSFCAEIKERSSRPIVEYIFDCLFWIATSTEPTITIDKLVIKNIREYRDAGLYESVGLLSLIFLPIGVSKDRDIKPALEMIQMFSIYDQYWLVMKWVSEQLSISETSQCESAKFESTYINDWLDSISLVVDDKFINQLKLRKDQSNKERLSSAGKIICNFYVDGNYKNVIESYTNSLDKLDTTTAFMNVVAKSMAYAKYDIHNDSILFSSLNNLQKIYSLNDNLNQDVKSLIAKSIQMNNFKGNYGFVSSIVKACPSSFDQDAVQIINKCSVFVDDEYTCLTSLLSKAKNEHKVYSLRYSDASPRNDVPRYREIKNNFIKKLREGVFDDQLLTDLEYIEPLKKDFYELKVNALLNFSEFQTAVDFSSKTLCRHSASYISFPFTPLIEAIEEHDISSLSASIVCFVYSRYISQDKNDLLNELVEDFILEQGADYPSDILKQNESPLTPEEVFFYERVCIKNVIDFLACFDNSKELAQERLKIIENLRNRGVPLLKQTDIEEKSIIESIIIDSSVAKISSSKVYVDLNGIKADKLEEISSLIDLYHISTDEGNDEKYLLLDDEEENEITHALVTGDKDSVLVKIMESILTSYFYDEKYGLDKNLSAEIRHGFFSNLMRSKPEESGLIIETDDKGEYRADHFWNENHDFLSQDIRDAVNSQIIWFTESFNNLLEDAEEWMKIYSSEEHSHRVFKILMTSDDLDNLKVFLEKDDDPNVILDFVLRLYWSKTEKCLEEMRIKINETLKDSIESLFIDFEERIKVAKNGASLLEFMQTIERTRNGIKEDILTASEWFHGTTSNKYEDVNIRPLLDIATQTFNNIKGASIEFDTDFRGDNDNFVIQGSYVKPMVLAMVNCFDNSIKYGHVSSENKIKIITESQDSSYSVKIINKISSDRAAELSDNFLDSLTNKMKSSSSSYLLRSEGGTGLKKAYQELRGASSLFEINLGLNNSLFEVEIQYGY